MSITTNATPPQGRVAFAFTAAETTTKRPEDVVRVATEKAVIRVARTLPNLAAHGLGVGYLLVLLGATVAGWVVVLSFAALLYVPSGATR